MKTSYPLTAGLLALAITAALGQPSPPPPAGAQPALPVPGSAPRPAFTDRLQSVIQQASPNSPSERKLTAFDLDFPGGHPQELVAAIQKAMGRPLNAIVPDEFGDVQLPALKMKNVTAPQLFDALAAASRKSQAVTSGQFSGPYGNYQVVNTGYGFRSQGNPTDDSIWYFFVEKPTLPTVQTSPAPSCRFYSLAPYVDRGLTVDDITTAIETGWKMLGGSMPSIRFHKDTKLLIAVGEPGKLEIIDAVLRALGEGSPKPKPSAPAPAPAIRSAEKPKTGE